MKRADPRGLQNPCHKPPHRAQCSRHCTAGYLGTCGTVVAGGGVSQPAVQQWRYNSGGTTVAVQQWQ
jgi:hypothetical protein